MMDARVGLRITGVVQGVGFRYFVKQSAEVHGLSGWVRNESDGSVTCEAEGDSGLLQDFIYLVRVGNRFSTVKGVQEQALEVLGDNAGFEIRY